MSVVIARSYSRYSGSTTEDSDTNTSGNCRAISLADALLVRVIGVGVQQADGNAAHTVLDEFAHSVDQLAASSSGSSTLPSKRIRPGTSRTRCSGTRRCGFTQKNELP